MSVKLEDKTISEIPKRLFDPSTNITYKRLQCIGRGEFGQCYEIVNVTTKKSFASKIMSKQLMIDDDRKDRVMQEISIHKNLSHPNIVQFHGFFDDSMNVYIIMELCKKHSMMELHKRRNVITEYECRYYMHQIIQGVKYLHDNCIIHRDLKLGNIFLDDRLHVKIGDLGLATRIEFEGERKMTLCGTPNYIAPEILTQEGHSYEVDIWSIGCVMYTLLVGRPPFETKTLRGTYKNIKKCEYKIPKDIRKSTAEMIKAMLQSNPKKRPSIGQLLQFDFLNNSAIPKCLPSSCLTMTPQLLINKGGNSKSTDVGDNMKISLRRPLVEANEKRDDTRLKSTFLKKNLFDSVTALGQNYQYIVDYRADINNLRGQLKNLFRSKPPLISNNLNDENTDPAAQPLFWITKWVDYSDKYGFGYQLCDEGMGVMFNDTSRLIILSNGHNVHFIDEDGKETYMTTKDFPEGLEKKMRLLSYFKRYMMEHLIKTCANNVTEGDQISRPPHLHMWFRTTCAVVMHLTNGSIQFNFSDHIKIILCPRMNAVTFMDTKENFLTYRFSTIACYGCSKRLYEKLQYAKEKLKMMLENMY